MEQQLILAGMDIDSLKKLSNELFTSCLFDSKNPSQIFAKILAGKELGIGPIASIIGINIIQGKPSLSSNLIAASLARHPNYKYRVLQSTNEICEIEVFENGESLGKCDFTFAEAQKAKLTLKDVWKNYPSDLLFARCISRAARRFAPGIFGGNPVYTDEEIEIDSASGARVINGELEPISAEIKPEDYKIQKESEVVEFSNSEQISIIVELCEKLQKGSDYLKKAIRAKFGHEDLTKVPKPFADQWQSNLQKRHDDENQFLKDMDGE